MFLVVCVAGAVAAAGCGSGGSTRSSGVQSAGRSPTSGVVTSSSLGASTAARRADPAEDLANRETASGDVGSSATRQPSAEDRTHERRSDQSNQSNQSGLSGESEQRIQLTGDERVFEGRASYYSDRLAGRSTASGEPYDPSLFTAASRDLAFGTRVLVSRLSADGEVISEVVVRVNDRGPFGDRRRVLDLSRAAAERLEMIRAGVVSVRVTVLSE